MKQAMRGLDLPDIPSGDEPESILGKPPNQSTIPESLAGKLTKQERDLFVSISKLEGNDRWQNESILRLEKLVLILLKRQREEVSWRTVFASKWAVVTWIGSAVFAAFALEIFKLLSTLKGP